MYLTSSHYIAITYVLNHLTYIILIATDLTAVRHYYYGISYYTDHNVYCGIK